MLEVPGFLSPEQVHQVRALLEKRNPQHTYMQLFCEVPEILTIIQQALAESKLPYAIADPRLTLSWHPSKRTIGPHRDTRFGNSTHKLTVCIQAAERGGSTIFYTALHGAETGRAQHHPGKAVIFNLDEWHSGEPGAHGTKILIGVKLVAR